MQYHGSVCQHSVSLVGPPSQNIYRLVLSLYFPRTVEEEDYATKALPADIGEGEREGGRQGRKEEAGREGGRREGRREGEMQTLTIHSVGDELGEPVIADRMIRIADNPVRRGELGLPLHLTTELVINYYTCRRR